MISSRDRCMHEILVLNSSSKLRSLPASSIILENACLPCETLYYIYTHTHNIYNKYSFFFFFPRKTWRSIIRAGTINYYYYLLLLITAIPIWVSRLLQLASFGGIDIEKVYGNGANWWDGMGWDVRGLCMHESLLAIAAETPTHVHVFGMSRKLSAASKKKFLFII